MSLKLRECVERHLHYVELIYQISKKLLDIIEKKDMDVLEFYIGNRERMGNILIELQKKIEELIKENPLPIVKDADAVLISWKEKFTFFFKKNRKIGWRNH